MINILIKYFLWVCLFGLSFGQVDYNSDIQTILNLSCTTCHGNSGGLNLSSYTNLMSGGNGGAVIIPYHHATSVIYDRITREESAAGNMPPPGSLDQSEIDLIAQWIDEGALEVPGSSIGCTDSEAYNCADDNWSCVDGGGTPADCMEAGEWPNYTFLVGTTDEYVPYINGCNYDNTNDYEPDLPVPQGGCESGPCEGYYNPGATTDDGLCDYYQAPHGDNVEFTIEGDGIFLDWTFWANNIAPENAIISGYNITRCTGGCEFITGNPFVGEGWSGWGNNPNPYTETSINDEFDWGADLAACGDLCGGLVKYSINVQYSNAEDYAMAIGTSHVMPGNGDMNGDGNYNVLDIVALANCVLDDNCSGYAGDMNGDGNYNVLDIVALANCVLDDNCGS